MADKPPAPAWAAFIADQARQTSTRSGVLFLLLTAGGVTLTTEQTTTIAAVAGAVAAVFSLIFQDRKNTD